MRNHRLIASATGLILAVICAQIRAAAVSPAFYVATSGNDGNDGSVNRPFATLSRAKSAMESSATHTTYLRGGAYSPAGSLTLTGADAGFSILAYPGEAPILDGRAAGLAFIIVLNNTNHVTIDGLTFTNSISTTGDFAALYLNSSIANTIVGNHFINNSAAMLLTTGASSNIISGNQIDNSASSAIEVKDGSNSNLMDSNLINGTGADSTHGGGFFLHGVNSNTISHNLVENTAGMGIGVSNWDGYTINIGNVVQYNVVKNTNTASVDSGAIYMLGRSQINTQAVIAYNYIDGTGGGGATHTIGIYLDDLTSGVSVHDNIIRNIGTHGLQIHGGQNVTVKNNIFDLGSGQASAVLFQAAPADTNPTISMTNDLVTQNIVYSSSTNPAIYDYLDGGQPNITGNLYFNSTGATMQTSPPTMDSNSIFGDPKFANAVTGAYALQANSAAVNIGFQNIDQSQMGLHPTTDHWYGTSTSASFTDSATSGVAPLAVTFDASASTGSALTYSWNFGDGGAGAGRTTNHTYLIKGVYTVVLTVTDDQGTTSTESQTISVTQQVVTESPYGGIAWPIPGTIEAENYDNGGEGLAYHDTTTGNIGGGYRNDDVDIRACSDAGGGSQVGWTAAGEWLNYTVNVAASGRYPLTARIAAGVAGGAMHIEIDGANVTGTISVPNTGGWDTWQSLTQTVTMNAGQHIMRVVIEFSGFDMNYFTFGSAIQPPSFTTQPGNATVVAGQAATFTIAASGSGPLSYQWQKSGSNIAGATNSTYTTPPTTTADNNSVFRCVVSNPAGIVTSNSATLTVTTPTIEAPYGGTAWPIPGTIQAEDYDMGGEGIAYHDTTAGNTGGAYRIENVDIRACSDTNGGYQVGWTDAGEWLNYSVNVSATGSYTLTERIAAGATGGALHVEFDGANATGTVNVPYTGGWDTWQSLAQTVYLTAGPHIMRVFIESAGFDMNYFNVNGANQPPVIMSAATAIPATAVTGQSVAFMTAASDPSGDSLTYSWNFGDGAMGSGASVAHVYVVAGAYTAAVTISDGKGGSVSSSVNVNITAGAATSVAINSGGTAVGNFSADAFVSGGATYTTSTTVNLNGVANPAPQSVYQSERYGNFTYSFMGLTAGASYTVRLHFAEIWWSGAGQRVFNVAVNGQQVLANFDIFAAAGGNYKAIVREFTAVAVNGQITVTYTTVKDNAKSSGIEVLSGTATAREIESASQGANEEDMSETAINSIDLGIVKVGQKVKILLNSPESGACAKRLSWSLRTRSKLAPGISIRGGIISGKPRTTGTYAFDLVIKSKTKGALTSATNTYTLTVVP